MMGKTQSYDFVYKKNIYGLEIHPEPTLTSRLSQADTPFNTKNEVSYLFLGFFSKNHIFSHLTVTLIF